MNMPMSCYIPSCTIDTCKKGFITNIVVLCTHACESNVNWPSLFYAHRVATLPRSATRTCATIYITYKHSLCTYNVANIYYYCPKQDSAGRTKRNVFETVARR